LLGKDIEVIDSLGQDERRTSLAQRFRDVADDQAISLSSLISAR
jgi:hypothetical protein